ncbi:LysR family transcriptional regulator [Psychromonas aquimarina]|uniref:LysR family transcriptional regulator n=1 Tax=Psychromonas aquimarina TaxID=444919 RepID=UPI0003F728BF|nr:LysR family transcriptional regulator [Psychromonas aquimarina]
MKDLNALRVFATLYQCGSTSKAARKLGRSQSYVSKVLAQLREELNDPLFVRTSIKLTPTSYADEIAPKLIDALKLVSSSLQPDKFNPANITCISIHMLEPYLITHGTEIIREIRKHSAAPIKLQRWSPESEKLILEDKVDIGFHILKDRPQTLTQLKVIGATGDLVGNKNGEFVKFIVPDLNEDIDYYKLIDPEAKATIYVDNFSLLDKLMHEHHTYRFIPDKNARHSDKIKFTASLIFKASQKDSPKNKWLVSILKQLLSTVKTLPIMN